MTRHTQDSGSLHPSYTHTHTTQSRWTPGRVHLQRQYNPTGLPVRSQGCTYNPTWHPVFFKGPVRDTPTIPLVSLCVHRDPPIFPQGSLCLQRISSPLQTPFEPILMSVSQPAFQSVCLLHLFVLCILSPTDFVIYPHGPCPITHS